MSVNKGKFFIPLFVIGLFLVQPANAGPYSDQLSRCIVESTSSEEKIAFVRWMFSVFSFHPAVKDLASIKEKQHVEADKKTAKLFMNLLTVSCRERAVKAIKYEGQEALNTAFRLLGEVAVRELYANPEVVAGVEGFTKYLDEEQLKPIISPE